MNYYEAAVTRRRAGLSFHVASEEYAHAITYAW